jgi:hypothetical protein
MLLEWIEKTDYDVKVIGLVRNPLSVLYSAQKLFHTDPEKRQYGWIAIQENLLRIKAKIPAEDFMLCRYEDIIQNPVAKFGKVCDFIGVDSDSSVGDGVHSGSVNKWESDPFFAVKLDDTVKEMAYRFGYGDDELFNPDKKEPSVFYRLKRKIKGSLRLLVSRVQDRLLKPLKLYNKNKIL